jgi:hypothetical protein
MSKELNRVIQVQSIPSSKGSVRTQSSDGVHFSCKESSIHRVIARY